MKNLKIILILTGLLLSGIVKAQVSVNVNIGTAPQWGPVGYTEVRYYYLPDVEAYYDIHTSMFIYFGGGAWIHRGFLPTHYSSYDLYSGYKVVMVDYHGNAPYTNFKEYKRKYSKGYKGGPQKTIGANPGKGNSKKKMGAENNSDKGNKHGNDKQLKNNNEKRSVPGNKNNGKAKQGNGGGKGKKN